MQKNVYLIQKNKCIIIIIYKNILKFDIGGYNTYKIYHKGIKDNAYSVLKNAD